MNHSLIFICLLLLGASCSQPDKEADISEMYNSIASQKHFYYNVEYRLNSFNTEPASTLYGLVSLNRNSESGISSAFFGTNEAQQTHHLQSMYLQNEWIYNISSQRFDVQDADVITDSLHSPILLNPALLWKFKEDSVSVSRTRIDPTSVRWTFDFRHKPDQMLLLWNDEQKVIKEIEYVYNVESKSTYSRKWSFDYLSKDQYNELEGQYSIQKEASRQSFL